MKRPLLLLILLWLLLLPAASLAAMEELSPESPAAANQTPSEPELSFPGVSGLTGFHSYFSHNVEGLSRRIDSFFGTTRAYEESSGTYLLLRGSVIYGRGGNIDYDGKVRAHLDLPNLSDRINLLIESEQPDQIDQTSQDTPTTGTSLSQTINDQSLAATLQYILQHKEFWDVRLQPGVKLHWPPDPYLRLRCRWLYPLSATWLSRVTFTPGWYSTRSWEARLRYDLERGTGNEALFRSSSQAVWLLDEPHNLLWSEVLFFSHPLSSRAWMAYDLGVSGVIEPEFEDSHYFASIRYRRDIHHGWVFLELKPQIDLDRNDDFKPDPSIALTLEMLFGGRYL
jgi:hypothetical protein